jgi:hypothetical protein
VEEEEYEQIPSGLLPQDPMQELSGGKTTFLAEANQRKEQKGTHGV